MASCCGEYTSPAEAIHLLIVNGDFRQDVPVVLQQPVNRSVTFKVDGSRDLAVITASRYAPT